MILDSSAMVAILNAEPDGQSFADAIETNAAIAVSAATVLETHLVLGPSRAGDIDGFLSEAAIRVAPFDSAQLLLARVAHARYGRGSGSKAKLNFGDCFSYALAKDTGEPLLFKGEGLAHTDITPARTPER